MSLICLQYIRYCPLCFRIDIQPEIFLVRNEDITCLQVVIHLFADLESWSELDAHGRHEVVGLEEHKGLPVNLLHHEVLHVVAAARQLLDEVANLSHGPPSNVHLCDGHNEYDSKFVAIDDFTFGSAATRGAQGGGAGF